MGELRDDVHAHDEFFRTDHQLGLVLADLGPGLQVLAETPARPGKDPGAMAIVTTYGLDDDTFARERARWAMWWAADFPAAPPAVV